MKQILADVHSAPISEPLRATLLLLRKMTLEHESIGADDVRAVLRLGVTREAIEEAMHIAYLFNIYDRLADTMGWHVPSEEGAYRAIARRLLEKGY